MTKLTSMLQDRFKKKESAKITELAEKSSGGNLTVFSGIFGESKLGEKEKETLLALLQKYAADGRDLSQDLQALIALTSEVRAINNQAAILHGERIKRAQEILKSYQEGAFTAWLLETYGNRQTPYNFLQYYEFYSQMPKTLHPQIEAMPRQAVYTLASRDGALSKKEEIVRNYNGESKQQLITLIRSFFPLDEKDRRRENLGDKAIKSLQQLADDFENREITLSKTQKKRLLSLLDTLIEHINVI